MHIYYKVKIKSASGVLEFTVRGLTKREVSHFFKLDENKKREFLCATAIQPDPLVTPGVKAGHIEQLISKVITLTGLSETDISHPEQQALEWIKSPQGLLEAVCMISGIASLTELENAPPEHYHKYTQAAQLWFECTYGKTIGQLYELFNKAD